MTRFFRWTSTAALAASLFLSMPALAKKPITLDYSDDKSVEKFAESIGMSAMNGFNKKSGLPNKVVIAGFQMQYSFNTQEYGSGQYSFMQLQSDDYQQLTDAMYDVMVDTLKERGFEVLGKDAVIGASHYQNMMGQEDAKEKRNKAIYSPTGMKRFKQMMGVSIEMNNLSGLNEELGTDAVLYVVGHVSICEMGGSKKKGVGGTKVCLGKAISGANKAEAAGAGLKATYSNQPAFSVQIMSGAQGGKMPNGNMRYNPKAVSTITYGGIGVPWVYTSDTVLKQVKKGLFGGKYSGDVDAYTDGALSLWAEATNLGFTLYDMETEKLRKKLGQ